MVLAPTRELCIQEEQAKLLGKGLPFKTALVVGGNAMAGQVHRIQQGVSMIVATGVLGRGVDLLYVRQVIVFDMPNSTKKYVHMIGRASRMGEDGAAIVFVNEDNRKIFPELVEILESSDAVIPRELANLRHAVSSFSIVRAQKKRKHGY
ncbi:hypothetical protein ABFX02_04G045400 [Erythranthe guttata]